MIISRISDIFQSSPIVFLFCAENFIKLLCGESRFRNDVLIALREAVVKHLRRSYADNVPDLVEEIVGIEAVRPERVVNIIELAVAAREVKALSVVDESSLSYSV